MMFRGLLHSPCGLTLFVPTRHAAPPLMNLRFFSLTKKGSNPVKNQRKNHLLILQFPNLSTFSCLIYKIREGLRTVEIDVIRYGDFF
jgi:hypothetical protein